MTKSRFSSEGTNPACCASCSLSRIMAPLNLCSSPGVRPHCCRRRASSTAICNAYFQCRGSHVTVTVDTVHPSLAESE